MDEPALGVALALPTRPPPHCDHPLLPRVQKAPKSVVYFTAKWCGTWIRVCVAVWAFVTVPLVPQARARRWPRTMSSSGVSRPPVAAPAPWIALWDCCGMLTRPRAPFHPQ